MGPVCVLFSPWPQCSLQGFVLRGCAECMHETHRGKETSPITWARMEKWSLRGLQWLNDTVPVEWAPVGTGRGSCHQKSGSDLRGSQVGVHCMTESWDPVMAQWVSWVGPKTWDPGQLYTLVMCGEFCKIASKRFQCSVIGIKENMYKKEKSIYHHRPWLLVFSLVFFTSMLFT